MVAQYIGGPSPQVIIKANVQEVAQLARRFSESQVETWRKVPWLALQAEGRVSRHYTDSWLASAYKYGLWVLPVSQSLKKLVHVDCETGRLVDHELKPLNDMHNLAIAAQVGDLDASKVCAHLTEKEKSRFNDHRDEHWSAWREAMAAAAALEPVYKRTMPLNWDNWVD